MGSRFITLSAADCTSLLEREPDEMESPNTKQTPNKSTTKKKKKNNRKRKKRSKFARNDDESDVDAAEEVQTSLTGLGISSSEGPPRPLPTRPVGVENRVDRAVRKWQELNNAPHSDANELYDLCVFSETIVFEALVNFKSAEIETFKKKLEEFGYEVKNAAFHHAEATNFALLLPEDIRYFHLTKAEREQATEKLSFISGPDNTWKQSNKGRKIFHPRLELWVRSIHGKIVEAIRRGTLEDRRLEEERLQKEEEQLQKEKEQLQKEKEAVEKDPYETEEEDINDTGEHSDYDSIPDTTSLPSSKEVQICSEPRGFDSSEQEEIGSSEQEEIGLSELEEISSSELEEIGSTELEDIGSFDPEDAESASRKNCSSSTDSEIQRSDSSSTQSEDESSPKITPRSPDPISNLKSFPNSTMSNVIHIEGELLPVPEDWSAEGGLNYKTLNPLSATVERSIEPVGPYFLAHARRARHKRTFSEDDRIQAQENVKRIEEEDDDEISESEDSMMLSRDAKDWKNQDHYAVLGLSKYRYRATEEQIKRAHRKKVLRHHPDKKAAAGSSEDDNFFKCIQKATEILLDPIKRRQYDSVDENADIEPPTKKQVQKGNFYKLWGIVFKSEARFSKIQPVPKFGDEKSSKEEVENFYNFWYNFDSWRSFEYQDEEVPDDNENRDQKRHMERKNNNARKKKKTEDSARLRKLLDECSGTDERIKKFRQEANASRNKKRLEKEAAEKKAAEEAKAKKEAEEKAAKEAEEAAKAERELGKKAKEAAKNAIKKNKRVLKNSVKDANYFVQGDPPAAQIDAVLNDVELIQGKIDADEIAALARRLSGVKVAHEIRDVWSAEVKRLVEAAKLKDGEIKTLV